MTCSYIAFAGYIAIVYALLKLLRSVYNVVFPYLFAVPQNLPVLAGAKWAVVSETFSLYLEGNDQFRSLAVLMALGRLMHLNWPRRTSTWCLSPAQWTN